MGTTLGTDWALDWMTRAVKVVSDHRIELIELDRAIGDGDHGENLDRGFTAVAAKLAGARPADAGEVLKTVATTLMSTVGGAAGPLYGTAFLRGAKAADGELDAAGVAAVLEAGLQGIKARGKAEPGEKTMVDAWTPAAAAAREAAEAGRSAVEALRAAADAAVAGSEATIPMTATKGRASYLGERSAGHRDPGAESSALLLVAAAEAAEAAA
ncbi:dihydroxyacetone kinase subunit DhaL [Georgenia sp. SYP-B2076]|uniref:dihydroxyacetone kinase subunit DhaL n=1 Tax=Georgenia sp. SYP-B2076 TaxID=2495881 RepID=UPI000F8D1592|nr:dihydroxyacetone kinase subunit DhaL [Georgenia sp. SYP-B2076]